jgi:hypothetical protein
MQQVPRVALIDAVNEGKSIEAELLQLKLKLNMKLVTEDQAVDTYAKLLERIQKVQQITNVAGKHVRELGPPRMLQVPNEMVVGLTELSVLAAELKRDPKSKATSREMARVNGEQIRPAAQEWYERSVGVTGVVSGGHDISCDGGARVESIGPNNLGVSAASVEIPAFVE